MGTISLRSPSNMKSAITPTIVARTMCVGLPMSSWVIKLLPIAPSGEKPKRFAADALITML